MAGWSHKKRVAVEEAFYQFLNRCFVNSRDYGRICLGETLYWGQRLFITEVFDALEADIHDIWVLKSRQLGLSTIARALTMFLLGIHAGLKGAIVFDTDQNKSESRAELEVMIEDLPASLKFPAIKGNNRAGLTLENNSKVLFMSAGVRQSKTSGTLGRSVGLSLAHLSELCSYDNPSGIEAFNNSLSEVNPDRLYIRESTARGYNQWTNDWKAARADPDHNRCIFLGWWSKESQRIDKSEPDFLRYGVDPPSEKETVKIKAVREQYGFEVTVEQLAWYRRKTDPSQMLDEDVDPLKIQEQPWTEEEAFQQTGAVFFANEKLTDQSNKNVDVRWTGYMYNTSAAEFTDLFVIKAQNYKSIELKVWEEPEHDAVYAIGVDPAYGENEDNDRSSIQVIKCFADGCDQVAEYAWPLITTRQLSWVLASLMGWYGQSGARVHYCLELNGPGTAVLNGLKELKYFIERGYRPREVKEKGLQDIFRNVHSYIYNRPDSVGVGTNVHFKTNMQLKVMLMERLRDFASQASILKIRSADTVEEMRTVARDGDSIKAPSSMRDDRVVALALATHCWETKIKRDLMTQKRTRESEMARKRLTISDQVFLFHQNQLEQFFKTKQVARTSVRLAAMRSGSRFGGSRFGARRY
jgi:hypothetical protein